ncbi:MAG: hypothetical protein FWG17_08135 [Desulfovibrionaceae bacterium]|nr:hypothetical protein [Desulfovibrionaceae bacterium]
MKNVKEFCRDLVGRRYPANLCIIVVYCPSTANKSILGLFLQPVKKKPTANKNRLEGCGNLSLMIGHLIFFKRPGSGRAGRGLPRQGVSGFLVILIERGVVGFVRRFPGVAEKRRAKSSRNGGQCPADRGNPQTALVPLDGADNHKDEHYDKGETAH